MSDEPSRRDALKAGFAALVASTLPRKAFGYADDRQRIEQYAEALLPEEITRFKALVVRIDETMKALAEQAQRSNIMEPELAKTALSSVKEMNTLLEEADKAADREPRPAISLAKVYSDIYINPAFDLQRKTPFICVIVDAANTAVSTFLGVSLVGDNMEKGMIDVAQASYGPCYNPLHKNQKKIFEAAKNIIGKENAQRFLARDKTKAAHEL